MCTLIRHNNMLIEIPNNAVTTIEKTKMQQVKKFILQVEPVNVDI